MQNKTHLAIGIFFMLFFVSRVVYKLPYVVVFLIAILLPNLDRFISIRRLFSRSGKGAERKRGLFHSFTFCFIITAIFTWFYPIGAFPFFLAYGTHLITDSWTVEGIKPFWPFKYTSKGSVKNGGSLDQMIFYGFIVADVVMLSIVLF